MPPSSIIIGSQIETICAICEEVASEIHMLTHVETEIEDFLLAIQENDYVAIIFDLDMKGIEAVKTIRLIRRMRPKIPLIVIATKLNKNIGGQILNEGVFHIIVSPPTKISLRTALEAVSKTFLKNNVKHSYSKKC